MKLEDVKPGLKVKITRLGSTTGMMINTHYLETRTIGAEGIVGDYVQGHGGDVWWIAHNAGDVGAYVFDEFELIDEK